MYKVVKVRKGKIRSCRARGKKVSVTYIPGRESKAPKWLAEDGYHLCVFKSLSDARNFANFSANGGYDKIWRVRTRGVLKRLPPCLSIRALNDGVISGTDNNWPIGTKMAKVVILTKEVSKCV